MAKLEIQITGNNENLKKVLAETKSALGDLGKLGIDAKPLTAYQAELLKIKQQTLDISKAKEEDRQAQKALNSEIKNQAKLQKEANDAATKKRKDAPFPSTNDDAVKKLTASYNGLIVTQDRSVKSDNLQVNSMNAKYVAYAKLSTEMAKQAAAQSSLTPAILGNVSATRDSVKVDTESIVLKGKSALLLAEEKALQAKATAELKNHVRETSAAKGSLDQRQSALIRLTQAYKNLSAAERESAAGTRLASIISGLKSQIKSINDAATPKSGQTLFDYLKSSALSAIGPIALVTAAVAAAREIFSHNLEISDSLADVQRTAKLSQEEVGGLSKELQRIPTRTDLSGLLDIGFIGGRLSVPKEELKGFIEQVDELGVVLKKEFPGGAEVIAESLGKIVTVYKITNKEGVSFGQALTKVGSAFLDLAHSGPVTVKYIQDFTLGIAGTAATARLSLPVIAAYGAVLGESGQIASSASLAVTRLVNDLSVKRDKYFAIAQLADSTLTIEKFTKLINTDTQAALSLFFKGLKAGNPAATELGDRLASVGIKTGKVSNAVKILAKNQDKLNDRIQKGSKSYEDATSISHNFEIANNTLGASVDKLSNSFVNLTTNPNGNVGKFFKSVIDGATYATKAIQDFNDLFEKSQEQKDNQTLKSNTTLGGVIRSSIFGGAAGTDSKEYKDALARKKKRDADRLQGSIADEGFVKADQLAAGKSEIQIKKLLVSEINKETIARDRLASALKFLNDPKNTPSQVDSVSKNINTLRANARRQNALVKKLKSKLPGNGEVIGDGSLVDQENGDRTIPVIKEELKSLQAANAKLDTQSALFKDNVIKIRKLKEELRLALGGKEKAAPAAPRDFKADITDVTAKAANYDNLVGLEDLDKTNEKTKQKYTSLNNDLDKLQKLYNAKYATGSQQRIALDSQVAATRKIISDNNERELTQNAIDFNKKKSDIIAGIDEQAGITRVIGLKRELEVNDAYYKEQTRIYSTNADILSALVEAKAASDENIRDKYRQKRVDAEQKIQEKIDEVTEKSFDSSSGTKRGNQKIDKDLADRIKKVQKYYDEIRDLNKNNPMFSEIGLLATKAGTVSKLKSGASDAKDNVFGKELAGVATNFGNQLIGTLIKANAFADKSFTDVIGELSSNLTESLNNVFLKKFGDMLTKTLDKAFDSLSSGQQALAGGAVVLGSVISGITKKTSYIGQGVGGALKGAGTGAVIGTAIGGPIGTLPGAIIGGVAGLIGGIFGAGKARKEEEARKKQLEEEKKQTALLERQNALAYSASIIGKKTVNGVVTAVEVNEFGQLTTNISGSDLQVVLSRANQARERGR